MLKIRDATSLAVTKLKAHKIWTVFFVLIETLLLTVLLVSASAFTGARESLRKFSSEGLNGRYLVGAMNWRYDGSLEKDTAVWDLADDLYDKYTSEHAAIADELGIYYSKDSEQKPTEYIDGIRQFNSWTTYAQMAIRESMEGRLEADSDDLEEILQSYDYKDIYVNASLKANGTIVTLNDEGEDFSKYVAATNSDEESIFSGAFTIDRDLFDYYLFDSNSDYINSETIPVVMSVSEMENYFSIEPLNDGASDNEKMEHFEKIKSLSENLVITACVRNETSRQLIFDAIETKKEIDRNKNNPNYIEPNLIYELPSEACGALTVEKDTRSNEEKQQDAASQEYQRRIGNYEEPTQKVASFRVVGLIRTAGSNYVSTNDVWGMLKSLSGVSLGTPIIPADYYESHKDIISSIFSPIDSSLDYFGHTKSYIIEFADAEAARTFIARESCTLTGNECATADKRFYLATSNNNSLVIEEISTTIFKLLIWLLIGILIVTMLSIGKTLASSITGDRKEISIFRAIGLRKADIAFVYLIYSAILALIIVAASTCLAMMLGFAFNSLVSDAATGFLRATFSTLDYSLTANIFMPNIFTFVLLGAMLILVSILSALPPIIINLRRNILTGLKVD